MAIHFGKWVVSRFEIWPPGTTESGSVAEKLASILCGSLLLRHPLWLVEVFKLKRFPKLLKTVSFSWLTKNDVLQLEV